jgi:hypothetical protein
MAILFLLIGLLIVVDGLQVANTGHLWLGADFRCRIHGMGDRQTCVPPTLTSVALEDPSTLYPGMRFLQAESVF